MKRWRIILPSLIATASLPLASLVGCGNESDTTTLEFENFPTSLDGYAEIEGLSPAFKIIAHTEDEDKDITKEANVTFDNYKQKLSWNKDEGKIHWDNTFTEGEFEFNVIASYNGKEVRATTTLHTTPYPKKMYFFSETTKADTYWNVAGQSEQFKLFYDDGKSITDVADKAEYIVLQHSSLFSVENKRLVWGKNVVPGTYTLYVNAKYNGIEATSYPLTIYANGMLPSEFEYTLDDETLEGKIVKYKGSQDVCEDTIYLPSTYEKDGETYTFTSVGGATDSTFGDISKLYLTDKINKIENLAIKNCPNLSEIHYPKRYEDWIMDVQKGENIISDCDNVDGITCSDFKVTNDINLNKSPESYFKLGYNSDLASITDLKTDGKNAQSIVVPNVVHDESGNSYKLVALNNNAIKNQDNLITLYLPSDLPYGLASNCITQCDNLTDIYYFGTTDDWAKKVWKGAGWIDNTQIPIHCYDGTVHPE